MGVEVGFPFRETSGEDYNHRMPSRKHLFGPSRRNLISCYQSRRALVFALHIALRTMTKPCRDMPVPSNRAP